MDNAFSPGNVIVYLAIVVVVAVFQWWLLVWAIRRALRDHAVWQYTTWPDMKKAIDEGRLDDQGKPTK
jgi:hypothetical protein